MSAYDFNDFRIECGSIKPKVVLINNVQETAYHDFNLVTKSDVLDFIFNNGLENLDFINTKEWEQNPDKFNPIMVDAYEFSSFYKQGYIAFMFNNKTSFWIIKSFKLSDNRNPAMEIALRNAGLLP